MLSRFSSKQAFTLIELLVVVVIIGVISAISIPIYRDYVNKAEISKLMKTFPANQLLVVDYVIENGFPDTAAKVTSLNSALAFTGASNPEISSVAFTSQGLKIVSNSTVMPAVEIIMVPSYNFERIYWSCGYGSGTDAGAIILLPKECQNEITGNYPGYT